MDMSFVEDVYETLQGETNQGFMVPGVENAFEEGKLCNTLYKEIFAAQRRLEERLQVDPYDEDVEKIITAMMDIQRELCFKMYEYGAKFGWKEE